MHRLGDFGLAKYIAVSGVATTSQEERAAAIGAQRVVHEDIPDALSSGVLGTLFYISPEIEKVCVFVVQTLGFQVHDSQLLISVVAPNAGLGNL